MAPNVDRDTLLRRIKETIFAVSPAPEVILYGSRARGDARIDSDWNLVVLTDEEHTRDGDTGISDALYDLELETGTVIVTIGFSKAHWNSPRRKATPFHERVTKEGIFL